VQRIQETGADFVLSCMQASDDITLARAIQQYGLKVHQLWFDGYDTSLLSQYSQLMQGVYLNINGNVPFNAPKAYPGRYRGMQQYLTAMQKYAPKFVLSQEAMQGWQSGALLVAGIKAAGSNLTQQNVIAKTNQITNFTAGGLATITNWQNAHTTNTFPGCSAFVQVKNKQFVPAVAKAPQAFVCFAKKVSLKNPKLVAPPPGTPGT
jgi:ABC-type branched-subunit amino acid transport system substrate-binding protein